MKLVEMDMSTLLLLLLLFILDEHYTTKNMPMRHKRPAASGNIILLINVRTHAHWAVHKLDLIKWTATLSSIHTHTHTHTQARGGKKEANETRGKEHNVDS